MKAYKIIALFIILGSTLIFARETKDPNFGWRFCLGGIPRVKRKSYDNGWDRNVQPYRSNYIVTHNGKALPLIKSTTGPGENKSVSKNR